ncbi:DUF2933 domain-containing protein [Patescibacteria group bacterium]|nr:DUF2933 domain-containing protein [Patescibacteria group bacterium]
MFCCSRSPKILIAILVIVAGFIGLGFYLQWPFIIHYWPFFIIFLCPLMHLSGGHNHGHNNEDDTHKHPKKSGDSCH